MEEIKTEYLRKHLQHSFEFNQKQYSQAVERWGKSSQEANLWFGANIQVGATAKVFDIELKGEVGILADKEL
jgi:ribonucleotide reductase beta subunit family protein with ferritin-like domain